MNLIEISFQWALGAGILEFLTDKAIAMCKIRDASVWTQLKYHSSGLLWPEFWNHKAIGMLRIDNASVGTPLKYHSSGLWPPYPTGMTFQWGPNTGIANFAHCYCLISSKLQNSGPQSPLEWYFNGVQTLASLILHVAIAVWVKKCKIPPTIAPWKDIYMGSNTVIAISSHYHCVISSKLGNSSPHCPLVEYFIGDQTLALLILQMLLPYEFNIAKFRPP